MTDPTTVAAIRERWQGCKAATYNTERDKAFGLLLDDVRYLLSALDALQREVEQLKAERDARSGT